MSKTDIFLKTGNFSFFFAKKLNKFHPLQLHNPVPHPNSFSIFAANDSKIHHNGNFGDMRVPFCRDGHSSCSPGLGKGEHRGIRRCQ